MKKNSRYVASEIIARWLEKGSFPDRQLAEVKDDRAFVTELVYGIVRRARTLEWLMKQFVSRESPEFVEAALYVGIYQLCFMDDVEEYAVLNETVEAVKMRRDVQNAAGLVNAVLRKVQEHRESLLDRLEREPEGVRWSHPEWLMKRWLRQYGARDTRQLCEWNNRPADVIIRIEPRKVDPDTFIKQLLESGIELEKHPFKCSDCFVTLPRGINVTKLTGWNEGWFTVQDPATSVALDLLAPAPGESVLDACAAPGGKTAAIASRMEGQGELVATDLHEDRLDLLRDTLKRTGWSFVEVLRNDMAGGYPDKRMFDAILLDVPCMNTGVLRRRVDARWRCNALRLKSLTGIQWNILSGAAKCVKPGGRIVYSTCSLEPEEGEDLVARWVREHSDLKFIKARKLFPPKSGTDGAYTALLRRG
jgi:16S rRNA (cytosine967-C5)-methyltransferase